MKVKSNNIDKLLREKRFRVSIFGSARIEKRDAPYKDVYQLARVLGEKGIDVVTGGGPGIMEAGSIGHKEGSKFSGAKSIGLQIKLPHEQKTNRGVEVEKTFLRFSKRLDSFMLLSNAVVVAPGGVGTMLELFYAWQLVQVEHVCNIPIILLGKHWKNLIKWLKKNPLKKKYFTREDMDDIFFAKNYKDALRIIEAGFSRYNLGEKDFCLNYRKYKI